MMSGMKTSTTHKPKEPGLFAGHTPPVPNWGEIVNHLAPISESQAGVRSGHEKPYHSH